MTAVIFDLDGTLIDSVPDIHAAVNRVFSAEGQAAFDIATITSFVGNGLATLVARAMAARGIDPSHHTRLTESVLAEYHANPATLTRLYPNVVLALETLTAQGHKLGLCTNKPESAAFAVLRDLELAPYFTAVVGGGRLSVLKPDPAPLRLCLQELGESEALFVGDSEVDAATAAAAGLPFLLYTEGYLHADRASLTVTAEFSDFSALPWLVAEYG